MNIKKTFLVIGFMLFSGSSALHADVKIPAIFSDHMILQQGRDLPVWGWADPGEKVSVSIAGQSKDTVAGSDGKWKIILDKIESKEALTLNIKGKNNISIKDVLIGDVWICGGQSNMQFKLSATSSALKNKVFSDYPSIRLFSVKKDVQLEPQENCVGKWEICNQNTAASFSGVGFFFGRGIHEKTNIPIGLIDASFGGSIVETWTSIEAQSALPEFKTIKADLDAGISQQSKNSEKIAHSSKAHKKKASHAYNSMINPLIPFAIKGVIWYQGESNAFYDHAEFYGLQLKTMINDWRARWGYDFPFGLVQLPEIAPKSEPSKTYWPLIREGQFKALKIPETGMAVTLGLGEANNIHPKNKEEVGHRLAQWALADVYGMKGISYQGPLFSSYEIKKDKIYISFKNPSVGIKSRSGTLKGFVIAGKDQKWAKADALIDGEKIIVSSSGIPEPVAVRYAWEANPEWSIVCNDGIPASPFRTDDWEIKVDIKNKTQELIND